MADFVSLIQTMQECAMRTIEASDPCGIFFGRVRSIAPIEIAIEANFVLTKEFLILSKNVTDHRVEMTIGHETEDETEHVHAIQGTYTLGGSSSPTSHRHAYAGRKSFLVHHKFRT